MSTKTTLLLLAIAGVLLGFIALYEKNLPKSWQSTERERYVLVFDRNGVEGIEISSNEDKVRFRKSGNLWLMEAPVQDFADRNAINQLLTLCETLQKEPVAGCRIADKKQLKAFGVSKTSMRLKLLGPDMPPELLFGKDTAVEGKIYVRLDGSSTVSVASNALRNLILRKPDEFRDRQLTGFDATGVNKFSVETPAGKIDLIKTLGHWGLVKPLKARTEDATVNAFLNSVLHTQITAFLPDYSANLNSYGLSEPRGTVSFWTLGSSEPAVLELGAHDEKTGGVYARISTRGAICLLPKESENILKLQPNDFRDRLLLHVDLDMVDRITLRPAEKPPIRLQRQREEWILRDSEDSKKTFPANKTAILQFVKELQKAKIAAFVTDVASDLAKYGFDQPELRITFSAYASENTAESNAGEMPILTLAFGKTEGDNVYARVEEEPFIVSVNRSLLDAIRVESVQWRSRALLRCNPSSILGLTVTSYLEGNPGQPVSVALNGDHWEVGEGSTPGTVNSSNIQNLINTLASLNAMQWTNETDLAAPTQTVEFTMADGKKRQLILGVPAPDGTYLGRFQDEPGVFRLAAPDVSALRLQIIEPAQPIAPPESSQPVEPPQPVTPPQPIVPPQPIAPLQPITPSQPIVPLQP